MKIGKETREIVFPSVKTPIKIKREEPDITSQPREPDEQPIYVPDWPIKIDAPVQP